MNMYFLMIFTTLGIANDGRADVAPEVGEIEQLMVAHRNEFRSGVVTIVSDRSETKNEPAQQMRQVKWRIYFQDKAVRMDSLYDRDEANASQVDESVSKVDGQVRIFRSAPFDNGTTLIVSIDSDSSTRAKSHPISDPRLIGLSTIKFLNLSKETLSSLVGGRVSLERAHVEARRHAEQDCKCIVYDGGTAYRNEIIVSPESGYNPLSITMTFDSVVRELNAELAKVHEDLWAPVRTTLVYKKAGVVEMQEDLQISYERINSDIDPDVFSLKGMGVPEGKEVFDFTQEKTVVMSMTKNGPAVIPTIEESLQPIEKPRSDGRDPSWLRVILIANGMILLAIAAWVVVWRKKVN